MPNQPHLRKSLLIVDDDADFRALLRAFLSAAEFSVTEAADGRAAVRHIAATTYDVVVIDIVLPECDGLELIPKIRRSCANARILAVSGASNQALYLRMARYLGADISLEKPFTRERFDDSIRLLLSSEFPVRKN